MRSSARVAVGETAEGASGRGLRPHGQWWPRPELLALALITLVAAALRLWSLRDVPNDPFYDAAVRSMALSWHNFFFGAYEPGGTIAVDKPPIDLWLQVISTQLLGYGSVALKLPPAIAGTLAVPLLYDAVRRLRGALAGLASAAALAVLPIAVLSSRSDTMDSVAMVLNVAALWLLVRFAQTGRARWCYLAAAAIGVAFNVKVFQGLVCVPALIVFWAALSRRQPARTALRTAALTTVVFVVVALSWLTATLAFRRTGVPGMRRSSTTAGTASPGRRRSRCSTPRARRRCIPRTTARPRAPRSRSRNRRRCASSSTTIRCRACGSGSCCSARCCSGFPRWSWRSSVPEVPTSAARARLRRRCSPGC
jgi:hypothetical protein